MQKRIKMKIFYEFQRIVEINQKNRRRLNGFFQMGKNYYSVGYNMIIWDMWLKLMIEVG